MLDEPSIFADRQVQDSPASVEPSTASPQDETVQSLEAAVKAVLAVETIDYTPPAPISATFTGQLKVGSEEAFDQIDAHFAPLDYQPMLTTNEKGQHVVMAIKGRAHPKPRPWWPNAVLLALTLLSLLYTGAVHQAGLRNETSITLWEGWPYALSMVLILGTHELGHYFAARHHHASVTLPYFIPAPFGFGTLGAFIQLREPMRNNKVLFDVGAAGPLAGFIVALPVLLIGLATSDVQPLPTTDYMLEGDSVLYAGAKVAVFGEILPDDHQDVFINQLAKAGWTGLFITGLNLIPLGQLDGGHIVLTLLGRTARRLYMPLIGLFLVLSLFNSAWLLWTLLLFFLGQVFAVPMDTVTPLDPRRKRLAYLTMAIFVLVFVPNPLQIVQP
ncbi:site-2 protease family protein [Aggregatilinea lenta]|uniref:site-2 protease family protein n=1 Tax=Aggregatilinea lenta TaxID=913108 RepID=UPI000E5AE30C|nr:site-2 protease family protein [Aggregatilinea lenta]